MANLAKIAENVQYGRIDIKAAFPPDKKGQPGVVELVQEAIKEGVPSQDILNKGLIAGMDEVGRRFKAGEIYVPEVLIAAKAMKSGMALLKPLLAKSGIEPIGTFIIGTVKGDQHDIGKNLVVMMMEGAGFKVVDLGVDVPAEKFIDALSSNPKAIVGMSALLTTTMVAMKSTIEKLRLAGFENPVMLGGSPVTQAYADEIGADSYAPDAASAVDKAKELLSVNSEQ